MWPAVQQGTEWRIWSKGTTKDLLRVKQVRAGEINHMGAAQKRGLEAA